MKKHKDVISGFITWMLLTLESHESPNLSFKKSVSRKEIKDLSRNVPLYNNIRPKNLMHIIQRYLRE